MNNLFNYIEKESPIHNLTGATKLVCLLLWSLAAMTTYDTRLLVVLAVLGIALFPVGKIGIKDVSFMLWFTLVFLVLNTVLVYVFSPQHGTTVYGTCTIKNAECYGIHKNPADKVWKCCNCLYEFLKRNTFYFIQKDCKDHREP